MPAVGVAQPAEDARGIRVACAVGPVRWWRTALPDRACAQGPTTAEGPQPRVEPHDPRERRRIPIGQPIPLGLDRAQAFDIGDPLDPGGDRTPGQPIGGPILVRVHPRLRIWAGLPPAVYARRRRSPARSVGLDRRPGLVELARRHGVWLAGRSALVYAASAPLRRPRPYDPALDFDLRDPASAPWGHAPFVLRRLADPDAARRRRENYARLLAELAGAVAPGFSQLPDGASPFVYVWAVPHPSLQEESFPHAASRRRSIIGLPVHQELRSRDLARIAEAASAAL